MTSSILYRLRLKCQEHPYFKPLRFCSPSPGVSFLVGQRSQLRPTGTTYTFDDGKCSRRKPIDIRVQTPILLLGVLRLPRSSLRLGVNRTLSWWCQRIAHKDYVLNGLYFTQARLPEPRPSFLSTDFFGSNFWKGTCPGSSYLELCFILAPSLPKTLNCKYEPGDVV